MSPYFREYNRLLILPFFLLFSFLATAQNNDIEDVKKQAEELFEQNKYGEAKELFSQLVSLYPKDENYNYKFGACMLYVDSDKSFPLKYLEYAVSKPNVDAAAFYFLGKGYHYNYRFDDAITYFDKYVQKVDAKNKNKYPVEDDIRYCENGKSLMVNISSPVVMSKRKVGRNDFFASYKLSSIGGRVLFAPSELQTAYDRKMNYTPVMYKTNTSDVIYYSSYGDNGKTGLDIYWVNIKLDGNLSDPVKLPETINTPFDDSFPFLSEDETEFFFASKGHNSMGGFDVFKSSYNADASVYTKPQNLDYSVNTPDNDFMYAVDYTEGYAYFSSNRNCEEGSVYVYKIKSSRESYQIAFLAGVFNSDDTRSCKITIEDLDKHTVIGSYNTDKKSGEYLMRLRNGGSYSFLVEPFGKNVAYKGRVDLPTVSGSKVFKQEIEIVNEDGTERLIIRNMFEEPVQDGDDQLIAEALMAQADIKKTEEPHITVSSDQLAEDLEETKLELERKIAELQGEAAISYGIAMEKRELSQRDLSMADRLEKQVDINDESEESLKKRTELAQLLNDAQLHSDQSEAAFELGKDLEVLATQMQKKLNKTDGYLIRINTASAQGDRDKIEELYTTYQNENTNEVTNINSYLTSNLQEEEERVSDLIKRAENISDQQNNIKSDISLAKMEKNATKKKKDKESYHAIIEELELELAPLEQEKKRLYVLAEEHSQNVSGLKREIEVVPLLDEKGTDANVAYEQISPEQKTALIESIVATSEEIVALQEVYGMDLDESEVETEDENLAVAEESASEIDTEDLIETEPTEITEVESGSESANENEEVESPVVPVVPAEGTEMVGTETSTDSSEPSEPEETNLTPESYYAYTESYEDETVKMVMIEGESVPMEITPSTGKKQYTVGELQTYKVKLTESDYNNAYNREYQDSRSIEDSKIKAVTTQRINYQWLVEIEKEMAALTLAKEQSNNEDYNNQLQSKIDELEAKANQKRNFMALNSQIIKQLRDTAIEAVAEGNEIIEEESAIESPVENVETEDLNTQLAQTNENETADFNEVVAEEENVTNAESTQNPSEEVNEAIGEEENSTAEEAETNPVDIVLPVEPAPEPIVIIYPSEALVQSIEDEKVVQLALVEDKKSEVDYLSTELDLTKKKKERAVIEQKIQEEKNELAIEQKKMYLLKSRANDVVTAQDAMVANPLSVRPSYLKFMEAKTLRTRIDELNGELEDLQDELDATKKKKQRKILEAQIIDIENEIALNELEAEMLLKTANEMSEIEILTLKRFTNYGVEEMVKLPEVNKELTTEEIESIKLMDAYVEYETMQKDFDKSVVDADVLYQSALAKEKEVKAIDDEIAMLRAAAPSLTREGQDSVSTRIVNLLAEKQKLVKEADVYYKSAKFITNEAYFALNEANSRLLTLDDGEDRINIIAALNGQKPAPAIDMAALDSIPNAYVENVFVNSDTTFYSEDNPIPVDVQLPSGVVWKVQIGAFRNPIKQETFKGFAPITGEKTTSGLTRYTAGMFKEFTTADQAKTAIRTKGYSDAFVVAYLNGERISIARAKGISSGEEPSNLPSAPPVAENDVNINVNTIESGTAQNGVIETEKVQDRGELYFTVQVGVFYNNIQPSSVFGISPLNTEVIPGGFVRYSSGVYGSLSQAVTAKNRIVAGGISDAFVTAYYNGKRISIKQAKAIANGEFSVANNPTGPTATNSEIGSGHYYILVGPYLGEIPIELARVLLGLTSIGVDVENTNSGTLYKIGNFTDIKEANALRDGLKTKGFTNPVVVEIE